MLYRCLVCGEVTKGRYKESPQYGSYYSVKCACGRRGNSGMNWNYNIDGFERIPPVSSNRDYAAAVKNLINSDVDCVQTTNGAYVNLEGVIDCLNRALHDLTQPQNVIGNRFLQGVYYVSLSGMWKIHIP